MIRERDGRFRRTASDLAAVRRTPDSTGDRWMPAAMYEVPVAKPVQPADWRIPWNRQE